MTDRLIVRRGYILYINVLVYNTYSFYFCNYGLENAVKPKTKITKSIATHTLYISLKISIGQKKQMISLEKKFFGIVCHPIMP
jgi:hypothetical protein